MNWNYFGNEIKVSENGYFEATVDGRNQTKQTLAELKEWIDKEIAANVKKITIELPVCVVTRHKDDSYSPIPRLQAIRTVITGVNRQTGQVQCKDTPSGFEPSYLIPDSDENFALCEQYIAANKAFSFFQRVMSALRIDSPGGRIDAANYKVVLDTLTRKHGEKVALGSEAQESVAKWKEKNQ